MINSIRSLLQDPLFQRPADCETALQIVRWWELRRIPYNLIVGLVGIFNCACIFGMLILFPAAQTNGFARGFPGLPLVGIFIYGVMANICYSGGWVAEIAAVKIWERRGHDFGQISFALGILFSILLTMLPATLCLIFFIIKSI
ncbi:MAG TPA: hypothetical protein VH413_07945 [Verrucomicrobiae bacterium]|jgi:hypothetical protein|nr:hypothetical protein [Verrucomicrobiae bacterium]